MFEHALRDILDNVPSGARVVDLYGGVGTIGLPAAKIARSVVGVEINQSSVDLANLNAAKADIANYTAVAVPAERMDTRVLKEADCVIVDPPRAGLHQRVIGYLLEAAPKRIIYLSCNPVTQARDLMMLAPDYRAESVLGYDFYPGTLHIETLAVLDRTNAE
jgi:23S rRNA (uracil1939-C5)-methyltransferase